MAAGANTKKSVQLEDMDASLPVKIYANQGKLHVAIGYLELATPGIGLQASMVRIPSGAVIVGGEVWWDAMGSSTEITVGDSDDTDRFMTVCPVDIAKQAAQPLQNGTGRFGSAGTGRFNRVSGTTSRSGSTLNDTGIGYRYTCEKDILISFNDQNPTGTMTLRVDYLI